MYLGVFVGRYLGVFAGRYLGVFAGLYSGIFVLSGYDVRASTLFTAVALCELLKSSASSLWPWSLQYVQQSRQAMANIQVYVHHCLSTACLFIRVVACPVLSLYARICINV